MNNNTILAFHIGRGGRFYNSGYLSFIGESSIADFTENLFIGYENDGNFKNRLGYDTSYGGVKCILDCFTDQDTDTLEDAYGITEAQLGECIYKDSNGCPVGLTENDVSAGIGRIDIDGDYDTTYTTLLKDVNSAEVRAIMNFSGYQKEQIYIALLDVNGYAITQDEEGQYLATNAAEFWTSDICETEEDARANAIQHLYETL